MTDRINLQQLRARTQDEWQRSIHPELKFTGTIDIDTEDLLALIDAAEAAHTYANENGLIPNEPLATALDRFDHT